MSVQSNLEIAYLKGRISHFTQVEYENHREKRTKTVLPDVYTTLSFPELNFVDVPRAVTGLGGYKPAFLYDIVMDVMLDPAGYR